MKRPFSQRRSGYGSGSGVFRSIWAWGLIAFVVLVLILLRMFAPGTFMSFASPLWGVGNSLDASTAGFFAVFENKARLSEQNTALEEQVATLTNENQVLTARAQDLTKLLGGSSPTSGELLAGVLARPPESPYDTLTIAAGSADGVSSQAFVYSAGGIPIGTIQSSNSHTSQVLLFSTSGRSTSGWLGDNRIPVTLIGQGAGAFTATIPQTSSVAVGDTVYVPGPGALPVGTLVKISTDPSSPTATLYIQPLVNLFSITWVEVGRSS